MGDVCDFFLDAAQAMVQWGHRQCDGAGGGECLGFIYGLLLLGMVVVLPTMHWVLRLELH